MCLALGGASWHDRAHRDALRVPRVLDDRFLKSWNDFVYILLMVGRAFEASYLAAPPDRQIGSDRASHEGRLPASA